MKLDDEALAIGRIEAALNRVERGLTAALARNAAATRTPDLFSTPAPDGLEERHARLRAEVATAITDLDMLMRTGNHG